MSSFTISVWSIVTTLPSLRTLTFGLRRRAILSRRLLALISWKVAMNVLMKMTPVAARAFITSCSATRVTPSIRSMTLNPVSAFFARICP